MVLQFPPADDQPSARTGSAKLKYKVAVGVGGLAGLFGIGSTLAANISLNNGGAVEFGQGVAQTAACDDDGFMVTPVTSYDNAHSMFRLDKVQVSGLNLTPVGTGFLAGGYDTIEAARAAHPGQYWDASLSKWRNTCDNVVLDFKAYTDNSEYANYTENNYSDQSGTSISSPVMWSQADGLATVVGKTYNAGFAVVFDSTNNDSNYATGSAASGPRVRSGSRLFQSSYLDRVSNNFHLSNGTSDHASFDFSSNVDRGYWYGEYQNLNGDANFRPNAATISKITVQSMKYFPDNYVDFRFEWNGDSGAIPGLPPSLTE